MHRSKVRLMGYNSVDNTFRVESECSTLLWRRGAKVPGNEVPGSESSISFLLLGAIVPGYESSRERNCNNYNNMVLSLLGAKVCGNENSIIRSRTAINCRRIEMVSI